MGEAAAPVAARVREGELSRFVAELMAAAGADARSADAVTRALVTASARGTDTHGVRLAPIYVAAVETGHVNGRPDIAFRRTAPAAGVVDADRGFGHPASFAAVEHAAEIARASGVAVVAVTNSSHFGAAGVYLLEPARAGLVAFAVSHADALVAPHGGVRPFFGTNPLAFACPVAGAEPVVLDMATSSIPYNRVYLSKAQGRPLPPEVAVDEAGEPTRDPNRVKALMPVGGADYAYKGAGLAAMIDLVCAGLTGMAHGFRQPNFVATGRVPVPIGHCFMVLDPARVGAGAAFAERARALVDDLRAQPARPGWRVMAPGDPELERTLERARDGIPLDPVTWQAFAELAARWSIAPPVAVEPATQGRSR